MAAKRKTVEAVAVAENKITQEERDVFDSHNDESATREMGCTCATCQKVWATL